MVANKKQKLAKVEISGDALDEDFLLEDGFISDVEEEGEIILEEIIPPIVADETANAYSEGKKRKAEAVIKSAKPKKIKETSSEKEISLGLLETEELLTQFRAKQARAMPNSTELEMDEFRIEGQ